MSGQNEPLYKSHGQATILKLPKTHWVPSGGHLQQMVPQTNRKQSERLIQTKYVLCGQLKKTLTMSGTDDYQVSGTKFPV